MQKVLGEHYYIDLDKLEEYLDMSDETNVEPSSGSSEMKINIIKFEMVKMLLETVLSETEFEDDKLGLKGSSNQVSIPFKIAFNSLLNKKLINHY
jgi:hypothetical protein